MFDLAVLREPADICGEFFLLFFPYIHRVWLLMSAEFWTEAGSHVCSYGGG